MNIGDKLVAAEVRDLPAGSVIVLDDGPGDYNVVIKANDGTYDWYTAAGRKIDVHDGMHVGGWTLAYLPSPVPALKVGDIVKTEGEFRALPVGCVVVEPDNEDPESRPTVKVRADTWMYHDGDDVAMAGSADLDDIAHTVIYLPEVAA